MTVMPFPKFDTDVNYRHFGINGYFPWFVNGLYTYLIGQQEDERVYHKVEENYDIFESLSKRYSVDLDTHIVHPEIRELRQDVSVGDDQANYFSCLKVKKWINAMEVSLSYEPENPIILKSTHITRPIF